MIISDPVCVCVDLCTHRSAFTAIIMWPVFSCILQLCLPVHRRLPLVHRFLCVSRASGNTGAKGFSVAQRLLIIYPVPPLPPRLWFHPGCHYCSETPLQGITGLSPAQGAELIHRLQTAFEHSRNAFNFDLIKPTTLSVGNADFLAAGFKCIGHKNKGYLSFFM